MAEPRARVIDDKKFMWDGRDYASLEEAEEPRRGYQAEGFETRIVEEDECVHVYTRRVVSAAAIEPPPAV